MLKATSNTPDMWPLEPSGAGLLRGVVAAVIVPKVAVAGIFKNGWLHPDFSDPDRNQRAKTEFDPGERQRLICRGGAVVGNRSRSLSHGEPSVRHDGGERPSSRPGGPRPSAVGTSSLATKFLSARRPCAWSRSEPGVGATGSPAASLLQLTG
jgi:hypothetical protein